MFEYFPDNYSWSLTTATLFDEVGTISEPEEALRAVKHLAGGDKATANEAWFEAFMKLAEKLERLGIVSGLVIIIAFFAMSRHRVVILLDLEPGELVFKDPSDSWLCLCLVGVLLIWTLVFEVRTSRLWMVLPLPPVLYAVLSLPPNLAPDGLINSVMNVCWARISNSQL